MSARSLVMLGKVLGGETMKEAVRVNVPKLKLDSHLLAYFRNNDELMVYDAKQAARPGDWIIFRPLENPISTKIQHELMKIIYREGERYCSVSGKKIVATEYKEDIEMESRVLQWKPLEERKL